MDFEVELDSYQKSQESFFSDQLGISFFDEDDIECEKIDYQKKIFAEKNNVTIDDVTLLETVSQLCHHRRRHRRCS